MSNALVVQRGMNKTYIKLYYVYVHKMQDAGIVKGREKQSKK